MRSFVRGNRTYIRYPVIDGDENLLKWWQRNEQELPLLSQPFKPLVPRRNVFLVRQDLSARPHVHS